MSHRRPYSAFRSLYVHLKTQYVFATQHSAIGRIFQRLPSFVGTSPGIRFFVILCSNVRSPIKCLADRSVNKITFNLKIYKVIWFFCCCSIFYFLPGRGGGGREERETVTNKPYDAIMLTKW